MEKREQKIKSFTDLVAWQEAHKLAILIYKVTKNFPKEEIYGLTNQIRRAVISISSNIAEGFSRQSRLEKRQFYYQALGSLTELQNQLLLAKDVGYLSEDNFQEIANQTVTVSKLINSLIKFVRNT
ncbi:four helix bundle protein [Candidatus Shapirobacteria bacterium]|nr:four helix bundle protein [Candidatus Shapirobacteria bacterium]